MTGRKTVAFVSLGLALVLLAAGVGYLSRIAPSGTGYKAMTACTALFVSGRSIAGLEREEFAGLHPILDYVSVSVDANEGRVSAEMLGMGARTAMYREGLGCTLTDYGDDLPPVPDGLGDPLSTTTGDWSEPDLSAVPNDRLNAAMQQAFAEPEIESKFNTRALLVYHDGMLVGERYADGISEETALPGYSLTKTILGALIGIAYADDPGFLKKRADLKAWRNLEDDDPRREITISDLLHMTTATHWSEATGDPLSPILKMTYHSSDMAAYAAEQESEGEPGSKFQYNSGSSLILSRLLLDRLGNDTEAYLRFPREKLFAPTGMASAIIAADARGTLNGGFGASATARDWLRFGLLYLNNGKSGNQQVLPEGWIEASKVTQPASAERGYGLHVWVNQPFEKDGSVQLPRPRLPADTLLMNGQFGQLVAVVPSRKVVIVRLGQSNNWDFSNDPDQLIVSILSALPEG